MKTPKEYKKELLENLRFDKRNTINALPTTIYINKNIYLTFDNLDQFEHDTYNNVIDDLSSFKKEFDTDVYDKTLELKQFHKFICFGSLLGTHISSIIDKFSPEQLLVIEPNLEIFRLSLFTTKYYQLSKKTNLILSIMEDDSKFTNSIDTLLYKLVFKNDFIKFHSTNINVKSYIEKVIGRVGRTNPTRQPYSRRLEFFKRAISYKKEYYSFIDISNFLNEKNDYPVLMLAAGPSLKENLSWLIENQNKFLIFAPLSLVEILLQSNILVDVILISDYSGLQQDSFSNKTKDFITTRKILSNASVDPIVIKNYPKKNIFFIESTTSFLRQKQIEATTIGDMSIFLLLQLQFKKIYLLGLDLAFDSSNVGYIDNYLQGKEKYYINENIGSNQKTANKNTNTITIKGNFRDLVTTQTTWYQSLISANKFISIHKKRDVNIYNLSDGAYIEGTIPLNAEDLLLNELEELNKTQFVHSLEKNSYNFLQIDEKNLLLEEIALIDLTINILENNFDKDYKNYNSWVDEKNQFYNLILFQKGKKFTAFYNIFYNLIYIIETYLNAQNNIQSFDDKIQSLNQIWKDLLLKYLQTYYDILKDLKDHNGSPTK